jgi:hypothetical protein
LPGFLPAEGLPKVEKNETLLHVRWNEPISVEENQKRVTGITKAVWDTALVVEADVATKQFLLGRGSGGRLEAEVYFSLPDESSKIRMERRLASYISAQYPGANFRLTDAPNAFDEVFSQEKAFLEARIKDYDRGEPSPTAK